jgi:hypothetical protein
VRRANHLRAGLHGEPDRGQGLLDARPVGDPSLGQRHVEVHAEEETLTVEIQVLQRSHREGILVSVFRRSETRRTLPFLCHPEERSDEGSPEGEASRDEHRSFASLRMTGR